MLRFLTGGESHGKGLFAIIEGLPSGLEVDISAINEDLARRQHTYGRSNRMQIEDDKVIIRGGLYKGKTTGAPLVMEIPNKDNHIDTGKELKPINSPRPGHADLAGLLKYNLKDIRAISERASARETAIRTAVGSVAKQFLASFGFCFLGFVVEIGTIAAHFEKIHITDKLIKDVLESPVRCPDPHATKSILDAIDTAKDNGDTLGGIFIIIISGVMPGLGSYVHWDKKLDGLLAQGILSIPSVKGVEIGLGFAASRSQGASVHDEIGYNRKQFTRYSNNAGGIEGGISNGEIIWMRGSVKPVPTLKKPLRSVNLNTKAHANAHYQRADICVVPSVRVIAEAVSASVLAAAFREKFGGDSMEELHYQVTAYKKMLDTF